MGRTELLEKESEVSISNITNTEDIKKTEILEVEKRKASGNMMLGFLEDNGLLIAFITALAYVSSYAFEKGYGKYYGLTDVFKPEVSVSTITGTITDFGMPLLALYGAYTVLNRSFPSDSKNIYIRFIRKDMVVPILISVVFLYLYRNNSSMLTASLLILLASIFAPLLLSFIFGKGLKGVKEHISERADQKGKSLESRIKAINSHVSLKIIYPIWLTLVCTVMFMLLGGIKASEQEDYFVIRGAFPDMVVIKENKDKLVVAPVDLDKKIITPRYRVIESKSNLDKPLVLEKIKIKGGLTVKEPQEK